MKWVGSSNVLRGESQQRRTARRRAQGMTGFDGFVSAMHLLPIAVDASCPALESPVLPLRREGSPPFPFRIYEPNQTLEMNLTPLPPSDVPSEPDNIVSISGCIKSMGMQRKAPGQAKCRHHRHVTFSPEERTIFCNDCKWFVDPFEYLDAWAAECDHVAETLKKVQGEIRLANAELNQIQNKIKNARLVAKRAGCPQTADERQVFFDAKWNPHHGPRVV